MGKIIEDRVNSAEFVASAVDTHAATLQSQFETLFAAQIHRGEHPQVMLVLTVLARALRARANALKAASDAHDRELADDDAPRAERDELTAALADELTGFRGAVETTYGPAVAKRLGFEGKTPTDPKPALALARKLLGTMADPKFEFPKPLRKGLKLDPKPWVDDINREAGKLDTALKAVTREVREAENTARVRDQAEHEHDALFGTAATVISSLMHLLGENELASRVRPSTRRPGTVDPTTDATASTTPAPTGSSTPSA